VTASATAKAKTPAIEPDPIPVEEEADLLVAAAEAVELDWEVEAAPVAEAVPVSKPEVSGSLVSAEPAAAEAVVAPATVLLLPAALVEFVAVY
jgi:hypothetical protein